MSTQDLSGQTFGQYELRELLGVGGMGAVYRAYQKTLRRAVAVKILPAALAVEEDFVERFHREAETVAALEHPHIIPVYDYGVQEGTSYIVMRLLTGGTLADRITRRGARKQPLPSLHDIADLLNQLAGAFDYAHSLGVIHRDIKPNNIMFDNQGNAFLVDFGIAKLLQATGSLTATGSVLGTPLYMAPEQWRSEQPVPATDQYALGVTIYQLMTGRVPFEAPTPYGLMLKHINEPPTAPHLLRPDLPEASALVLDRALAKTPEGRFPTVTAFAQAFERAIGGAKDAKTDFFTIPMTPKPVRPRAPTTRPSEGTAGRDEATRLDESGRLAVSFRKPVYRRPAVWISGLFVLLAVIVAAAALLLLGGGKNGGGQEIAQEASETPTSVSPAPTTPPAIVILPGSTPEQASPVPIQTATPTVTPTPTATHTQPPIVIFTDTPLPTATPTSTLTLTATLTPTPTDTLTPTATPDFAATTEALLNARLTQTAESFTDTPTPDIEKTVEAMAIAGMTQTAASWTATPTVTPTTTSTDTPTATSTPTTTPTSTFTLTAAPTLTPTLSVSPTPTPYGGGAGQFAFVSERDGNREIYVMNADGSGVRNLTTNPADDRDPAWSPDGGQIAFHSMRDGNGEIYVMNADGSNPRNLTNNPASDFHPAWSPDGRQIAFYSDRSGDGEVWVMNADGSSPRNLTNSPGSDGGAAWSPDGRQIVFNSDRSGNSEIYIMNADGSDPRQLTNDPNNDAWAAWSPDGRQITFASTRTGSWDVYQMDLQGNNLRDLTNAGSNDWWPAWTADGSLITFTSDRDGVASVYVMNPDGSNPRRLTVQGSWNYSSNWRPAPSTAALSQPTPVQFPTETAVLPPVSCQLQFLANINVRAGPGTEYDILGATTGGTTLAVTGRSADSVWLRVDYHGQVGWVSSTLASVLEVGDCSAVPVVGS
jgi:Tol biopolymer transport system component